ncbi:hypothetical protein SDC9_101481 [bioreactor metagenome]|uniref:Uncharacterized protein n=1 Tax=bioreactor metagenome TaxID=1076179 RepID=A0A645AN85_9ZZZZ
MLDGLIPVSILPHIHNLHLPDFVNRETVITVIKNRRHLENRIQHIHKLFVSTHQIDQPLWIVENRPRVVPAIALGERIPPFCRTERRLKRSILILTPHQFILG